MYYQVHDMYPCPPSAIFLVADSDFWSEPGSANRVVIICLTFGIIFVNSVADPDSPVGSRYLLRQGQQQAAVPCSTACTSKSTYLPRRSRPLQPLGKHNNQTSLHSQHQCIPFAPQAPLPKESWCTTHLSIEMGRRQRSR